MWDAEVRKYRAEQRQLRSHERPVYQRFPRTLRSQRANEVYSTLVLRLRMVVYRTGRGDRGHGDRRWSGKGGHSLGYTVRRRQTRLVCDAAFSLGTRKRYTCCSRTSARSRCEMLLRQRRMGHLGRMGRVHVRALRRMRMTVHGTSSPGSGCGRTRRRRAFG